MRRCHSYLKCFEKSHTFSIVSFHNNKYKNQHENDDLDLRKSFCCVLVHPHPLLLKLFAYFIPNLNFQTYHVSYCWLNVQLWAHRDNSGRKLSMREHKWAIHTIDMGIIENHFDIIDYLLKETHRIFCID